MIKNAFLTVINPFKVFTRTKITKPTRAYTGKNAKTPGTFIRYPGGIKYYPRPGEVDPEIIPSKLLRVERIKPLYGVPWFLKEIMVEFGLGMKKKQFKGNHVTIVKNIPEVNVKLWKVKHLVHITPITFPFGEPTMDDVKHTKLYDSGVCIVNKKIAVAQESIEAGEKFVEDNKRLNNEYIEKDCRLKWQNPMSGGF